MLPPVVAMLPRPCIAAKPFLDKKAEESLKRALLALYRDLTLLQNFAILNYTAVVKVGCGVACRLSQDVPVLHGRGCYGIIAVLYYNGVLRGVCTLDDVIVS